MKIAEMKALEVIDSRARPTVRVVLRLENNQTFWGVAPAGASKGKREVREIRDGGKGFSALRVKNSCREFNKKYAPLFKGVDAEEIQRLEGLLEKMLEEGVGGNFTIACSAALFKATASCIGVPVWQLIEKMLTKMFNGTTPTKNSGRFPRPLMNFINGGVHAGIENDLQEHLVIFKRYRSINEALMDACMLHNHMKEKIKVGFGREYTLLADEGGFVPPIRDVRKRFDFILECASEIGIEEKIVLGLDCAASQFYDKKSDGYVLLGKKMSRSELVELYADLASAYPLEYLEDGMAEDDLEGWRMLYDALSKKLSLVGDDITTTDAEIIEKYGKTLINGVIIKPNQIGTTMRTLKAVKSAMGRGMVIVPSHRSGDSEDNFIADFAAGVNADLVKFGAPARGERTCKYNRLIEIYEMEKKKDE